MKPQNPITIIGKAIKNKLSKLKINDSAGTFKVNGKDVPFRNDRQRLNQY